MTKANIVLPKRKKTNDGNIPTLVFPSISSSSGFDDITNLKAQIFRGPTDRLTKYREYDEIAADTDVSRALDIIAEHSVEKNARGLYFQFQWFTDNVGFGVTDILERHIYQWSEINKFNRKLHQVVRNTLKYGDWFMFRNPYTFELMDIHPASVQGAVIEKQTLKILGWSIKNFRWNIEDLEIDTNIHDVDTHMISNGIDNGQFRYIPAQHILHFSMSDGKIATDDNYQNSGMWQSNRWPFGNSWLDGIAKSFKERSLLEDAIILHRLQRAPNRHVFFIDTGRARPDRAEAIVERFKNEIIQKRMPMSSNSGNLGASSVYNPMSMLEDIFVPVSFEQRGSRIERLEGQPWTDVPELEHFQRKVSSALRVPYSWLNPSENVINSDARAGVATQEEVEFSRFCSKVQSYIIDEFDREFKRYCIWRGLNIVWSDFKIRFNDPTNYEKSRDLARLSNGVDTFKQLIDVPFISRRLAMEMALGWSEDIIARNERMILEETHGDMYDLNIDTGGGSGFMGIKPAALYGNDASMPDRVIRGGDTFDGNMEGALEPTSPGSSIPLTSSGENEGEEPAGYLEWYDSGEQDGEPLMENSRGEYAERDQLSKLATRVDRSLSKFDPIRRKERFIVSFDQLKKYRIKHMASVIDWKRRKRLLSKVYVEDTRR